MNPTLIKYAVIASILFGAGFGACNVWKDGQIKQIQLEHAHEILVNQQDAISAAEARIAAFTAAQNNKAARDGRNRAAADLSINAGNGLRIASADTVRSAQADASTCAKSIAIYDSVLNAMAEAGRRISSEADQWESDALMQHEAVQVDTHTQQAKE